MTNDIVSSFLVATKQCWLNIYREDLLDIINRSHSCHRKRKKFLSKYSAVLTSFFISLTPCLTRILEKKTGDFAKYCCSVGCFALDSVREGGQQWSATFECWDFQTGHLAEVDIFCGQFITTSAKVTPNGGLVICLDIFTCRFRKKTLGVCFHHGFLT